MKARENRNVYCPVRNKIVTEYLYHHGELMRITRPGQARVEDSKNEDVALLSTQLKDEGQYLGACILVTEEGNVILWGNTRHRSTVRLSTEGSSIKGIPSGYLWASRYNEPHKLISQYQAIENNIHPHSKLATTSDNVKSLQTMIEDGLLAHDDGRLFSELGDVEMKAQVIAAAKRCHIRSSTHKALWNRVKKSTAAVQEKMRSWEKHELASYFGNNNDYGLSAEKLVNFKQSCGWILETTDGRKIGLYFILNTASATATLSQCHKKRNINKKVDEIVIVASINGVNSKGITKARAIVIDSIKEWNPTVKGDITVDRVMFVPQTESEQNTEMISGHFILDTKLGKSGKNNE